MIGQLCLQWMYKNAGLVPETQVRLISRAENKVLLNMETDRINPLNVNHDSIYLVYVYSYFFNRD